MINPAVTSSSSFRSRWFVVGVAIIGMSVATLSAGATDGQVPWECSTYTDEAQTRCLHAFIERQQEQIGQLEGRLQAQQDMMGQLKGQIDRQNAATAQLQQQLSQPPLTTAVVPPPVVYPYAFAYPPGGIGVYLGRPWIAPGFYGFYGRPYWGPHFHRHYGRHW